MSHKDPPALRFLSWFCPPGLYEGIEGDLLEKFENDVKIVGEKKAKRRLAFNVVRFFRPGIILRNRFALNFVGTIMWKSYFKISVRSLLKSKGYSFINIFGLAIGIASCLLILNYIRFELSFDKTHPDVDRLFRVNQTAIWTPGGGVFSSSGPQLAFALKEDYPEVEQVMRINTPGSYVVHNSNGPGSVNSFRENNVLAADSNFFSFFDFKLKEGNPRTALQGVNKVVISDEVAKKFFGDQHALGKILQFGENKMAVEITGVTESQPDNIHFHFDYLLSIYTNPGVKRFEWSFTWTQVVTYVKLRPNADVAGLENKIQSIAPRRVQPTFVRMGMDYNDFLKDKGGWSFYLQPVKDIRLHSANIWNRFEEVGDIAYLYIFGGICLFILIIASINFINLSTARASMRAKEVGVKKSLGAFKWNLIFQFQFESIMICVISTLLAVLLMALLKPVIFEVTGFRLPYSIWSDSEVLWWVALLPLALGFLAGIYPSFYLTAFQPVQVLKGRLGGSMKSGGLRNVLVLVQFSIAIAMMAVTLVVYQQIRYMSNKNLGLDKEHILLINHAEELGMQLESFRNEIAAYNGVLHATASGEVPGRGSSEDIFGAEGTDISLPINTVKIDRYYFSTLGLKLSSGREFVYNTAADKVSVIINENGAKLFGWTPEEAVGKQIVSPGVDNGKLEIVGVVKDFHFRSLHSNISPLLFFSINSPMWGDSRVVAVKFKTNDAANLREKIEKRWSQLVPASPLDFSFYEEELEKQYQNEKRLAGLFFIFTAFSIGVGIIGLIGLVAYSADQRKKEIGIRKVFGASITRIFVMMNKEYIKLMLVAILVATPLAWWILQKWLASFAYHIDINPMVFLLSGGIEIVLSFLCVSYLSIRAAGLNPSKVLKEE